MAGKYLRQLLYFSATVGAVALFLSFLLPGAYITPTLPFLILFFIATSFLSFYYLLKSATQRFIRFVNAFLLTIIAKLFLYASVMIGYAFVYRVDAVPFLISFFLLYLVYTVFETVFIVRYNNQLGKGTK
jgi:hypothetical protein